MHATPGRAPLDRGILSAADITPRQPSTILVLAAASGITAMIALTVAAHTYLSMRSHGHSFTRIVAWQLGCWMFWGAVAPIVLRAGGRLSATHEYPRGRWASVVALGAVLTTSHAILAAQLTVWVQPFVPVQTHRFGEALLNQLGLLLIIDLLAYSVVLVIGSALAVYDRARRLELRESRLEAQLTRANLEALLLEIQPHFLFNTLNTIGALIRRQSTGRALDMLVGLSELMRDTLERRRGHVATLESEVDFVRKYVDLYRTRFSDRLSVAYDLDPAALGYSVPTFVLQPLVENAFRHGVARHLNPSHVEIGARLEPNQIRLWVADDGIGISPDFDVTQAAGTGLSNVRSRVECLFGPSASVDVRPREAGGTIASILLPLTRPVPIELAAS
jgi:two-component system LytT family sensor kinase